jgi:hypothetical protein
MIALGKYTFFITEAYDIMLMEDDNKPVENIIHTTRPLRANTG